MPAHLTTKATPRPRKGTAAAERRKRRAAIETAEDVSKRQSTARDGDRSRWPGCPFDGTRLESAHLRNKKMGGDHGQFSHLPKHYVTLTHDQHERLTLHLVSLLFDAGEMGDGLVEFYDRDRIGDPWRFVGTSTPPDQQPGARHGRCAVDGGVHTEGRFCKAFRPQ